MTDARDSQHDSGVYQDVIPMVRHWGSGGAAWADAPVIVAYVIWCMYADEAFLRENIASLDNYMDWLASRGMQGPAPTYGDWLAYDLIDNSYISKAYYALDAQIMATLHYALGNYDKSEEYNNLYFDIREDFRDTYMEEGDLLPEYRKQTGYLLALHTDMFDFDEIEAAADALEQKIAENGYKLSTGFVGTPILCTTLSKVGKSNTAYSLLLQTEDPSWLYSVHQGATTVWERWNSYTYEKGFGDVNMNSFNHYSFGAVMEWMYRYMVGIQSRGLAFEHVMFTPKPDMRTADQIPDGQELITWAKGSYKSAHGLIQSEWKRTENGFVFNVETPVESEFHLPIIAEKTEFMLNGKKTSIDTLEVIDSCAVIKLASGTYTVEY
jgi:alpha-L-rhamnosidase